MNRYVVSYLDGKKLGIRVANTALDAIERIADQYDWGRLHDIMYDADTMGEEWCKARVCWGGDSGRLLYAVKIYE